MRRKSEDPSFAIPANRKLTLRGFVSEDEDPRVASARIKTVAAELAGAGLQVVPVGDAQPSASAGRILYPDSRMVQITPLGATSSEANCKVTPPSTKCSPVMESALAAGRKRADDLLDAAIQGLAPLLASVSSQLRSHFKDNSAKTARDVKTNLTRLKTEVAHLSTAAAHDCGTPCDNDCRTPTAHMNGEIGKAARMTLCDRFLSDNDDERARDLIHEASHATDVIGGDPKDSGTKDLSNVNQRMFEFLSKDEALRNADSYTIFVLNVSSATAGGSAPADKPTGLNNLEFTAVRHTLALLQARLVKTRSELLFLYESIHKSKPPAKAWTSSEAQTVMRIVAPFFGLTLPPLLPSMRDQVAVAGIRERCSHLASIVFSAIDLKKVSAAVTSWSFGPGQQVDLGSDFFALGLTVGGAHVDLLLARLAKATPEIPTVDEPKYVTMARQIDALP